jgi:hypothetical protein
MHTSVHSLLPASVLNASVSADIIAMGLAKRHAFVALLPALGSGTASAVRIAIRESICTNWFNECVRRQQEFDLPVAVCSGEHLHVEVSVSINVLLLYKDWSSVSHIPRRRSGELIIVTIKLNGVSLWGDRPSTKGKFFGVVRLPNFNFGYVIST